MRLGVRLRVGLIDLIVMLTLCRNLRQMGDGDDLAVLCHLAHDGGHLGRYLTAHARVYLVKDDGGEPLGAGYQCLDAEHHCG